MIPAKIIEKMLSCLDNLLFITEKLLKNQLFLLINQLTKNVAHMNQSINSFSVLFLKNPNILSLIPKYFETDALP